MKTIYNYTIIGVIGLLGIIILTCHLRSTDIYTKIYKIDQNKFSINKILNRSPSSYKKQFITSQICGNNYKLIEVKNSILIDYAYGYISFDGNENGFLFAPLYFRNRQYKNTNARNGIQYIVDNKLFNKYIKSNNIISDKLVLDLYLNFIKKTFNDTIMIQINSLNDFETIIKNYPIHNNYLLDDLLNYKSFQIKKISNSKYYWHRCFGVFKLNMIKQHTNFIFKIEDIGLIGNESIVI